MSLTFPPFFTASLMAVMVLGMMPAILPTRSAKKRFWKNIIITIMIIIITMTIMTMMMMMMMMMMIMIITMMSIMIVTIIKMKVIIMTMMIIMITIMIMMIKIMIITMTITIMFDIQQHVQGDVYDRYICIRISQNDSWTWLIIN